MSFFGETATFPPTSSSSSSSQRMPAAEKVFQNYDVPPQDANGRRVRLLSRRASVACHCCRSRKVRCDVTRSGFPCTNCKLDMVQCVIPEKKMKRLSGNRKAQSGPRQLSITETNNHETRPGNGDGTPFNELISYTDISHAYASAAASLPPSTYPPWPEYDITTWLACSFNPPPDHASPSSSSASSQGSRGCLPMYLDPPPDRISDSELSYLVSCGALKVPDRELRDGLIAAYIQYVHPFLPAINVTEFVMTIEDDSTSSIFASGCRGGLSLILFQAVMFAGSVFVDMKYLSKAGYSSREQARMDLFQKTRVLYDSDYESDQFILLQVLLLLTYFFTRPNPGKNVWHWLDLTLSTAHFLGLHHDPNLLNIDTETKKLRKRLWWCVYMRTQLITLALHAATQFPIGKSDVPALTLDDMEIVTLPRHLRNISVKCDVINDVGKQRILSVMCIKLAELCVCMENIFLTQYSKPANIKNQRNTTADAAADKRKRLVPRASAPTTSGAERQEELQKLWDQFPHELRVAENASTEDDVIDVHWTLLQALFKTTLSALHVTLVHKSGPGTMKSAETHYSSNQVLRQAAHDVTASMKRLQERDLAKYLPLSAFTVIVSACFTHLLCLKSPDETVKNSSMTEFCQSITVLKSIRNSSLATDCAIALLEAAVRGIGIPVIPSRSTKTTGADTTMTDGNGCDDSNPQLQAGGVIVRLGTSPEDIIRAVRGFVRGDLGASEQSAEADAYSDAVDNALSNTDFDDNSDNHEDSKNKPNNCDNAEDHFFPSPVFVTDSEWASMTRMQSPVKQNNTTTPGASSSYKYMLSNGSDFDCLNGLDEFSSLFDAEGWESWLLRVGGFGLAL